MLIEQIAYCRLRLGNLQERAATARTLETTEAYHRMGVSLMAEFREMVLARETYRVSKGSRKAS